MIDANNLIDYLLSVDALDHEPVSGDEWGGLQLRWVDDPPLQQSLLVVPPPVVGVNLSAPLPVRSNLIDAFIGQSSTQCTIHVSISLIDE